MNSVDQVGRALRIEDLQVSRAGRRVIHGVSLNVEPGTITALLGANGAGKSSLVLAMGGAIQVDSGNVRLGEQKLTGQRPDAVRRAGLAVVPEGRRLLPNLSVRDNLGVATYALARAEASEGIDRMLELFPELRKSFSTNAGLLSGGEQQMVVLAQALISAPAILVVDELSLGLAPVVVKRLMPVLQSVAETGVGVLLIEQFAHVALALAEHALILERGRVRFSGTTEQLRDDPNLLHDAYSLGGADLVEDAAKFETDKPTKRPEENHD